MSVHPILAHNTGADSRGRRLESWKEIAAYVGRDVTTVRRWEKRRRRPVYRLHHSKLGSVYAYTTELDAWRRERASSVLPCTPGSDSAPASTWLTRRLPTGIGLIAIIVLFALGLTWFGRARTVSQPINASPRIRSLAVLPLENF